MTLVELILVVSLLAMLSVLMVPAINMMIRNRQNTQCAVKLRAAVEAFGLYASETGSYPQDQVVPSETTVAEMDAYYFPYFDIDWWGEETELGGRWDWDVGYHGFAQSVSIWQPTASTKQLQEFDRLIDDGDLGSGRFRKVETQYHYILED